MTDRFGITLDLLRRAQDGDADALERLMDRYYERVRRIVRVRLGPRLRGRLESGDILQETFVAALRSFEDFEVRDEGSFIHWLATLAERQICAAADHHGAQKRDMGREVPLRPPGPETGAIGIDPVATGMIPSELADRAERTELVERCLAELPEEDRELILMRDYAGASWQAIAEQTGRPTPDAARMRHKKALIALGKLVRAASRGGG